MKVLVLCAHTDDESGCSGTIARFIEEGNHVTYVAFSTCGKSVPEGFSQDILKQEVKKSTETLGIKSNDLIVLDYEVREFPAFRQSILENIVTLGKQLKPDLIILPSTYDLHQDHQIIPQEGIRAFKDVSVIGYEMLRNNFTFPTKLYIKLSKRQMDLKMEAMSHYRSQSVRSLPPIYYEHLAELRGAQIGVKYAEAFEAIRWIVN